MSDSRRAIADARGDDTVPYTDKWVAVDLDDWGKIEVRANQFALDLVYVQTTDAFNNKTRVLLDQNELAALVAALTDHLQ